MHTIIATGDVVTGQGNTLGTVRVYKDTTDAPELPYVVTWELTGHQSTHYGNEPVEVVQARFRHKDGALDYLAVLLDND